MDSSTSDLSSEIVQSDLAGGRVVLTLDSTLYPLDALYGASYVFIDRCYVLLDRPDPSHFRVTLSPKKAATDEAALRAFVGEFANELLSCAWRHQITQDNRAILEQVTNEAIAGAMGAPSLDDLANFDFTEEPFEDPLGIAMSWEEKYKKPKPEGATDKPGDAKPADPPAATKSPAKEPSEGTK